MDKLRRLFGAGRHLGLGWVAFRAGYAIRRRAGWLERRLPRSAWEAEGGAEAVEPVLFAGRPVPGSECEGEADAVLQGRFRLFSGHEVAAGFPPNWNGDPLSARTIPGGRHWSRIGAFAQGDIKITWELSRFSWAFALGRAHVRTGKGTYAEGFWRLFENWMRANPPNAGPNWMCGQEATFRMMAAAFARHVCAGDPSATPERRVLFRRFVTATARRIEGNLDYALSQSNNHGLSECIGLITASALLGKSPQSARWRRLGLKCLERQLAELVYPDGAFSQHSVNYHRVVLHDLSWCVALMRMVGAAPPAWMVEAGRRALSFLDPLLTPETGRVPRYGADDGSNILPLSDGEYLDYRPAIQMAWAVFHGRRRLPPGPWDEAAAWLLGGSALPNPVTVADRPASSFSPEGGTLVWRQGEARLFLRCPQRFRHRPSQADLLHVDLEWRGQPIAIDAGTFSYNAEGKFADALKEAAIHSTITFDGREPMEKAGRFLYLPWPSGRAGWSADQSEFHAEHDGWSPLGLVHRREVRANEAGGFTVTDSIRGPAAHAVRLHWLLADWPYQLQDNRLLLQTPEGAFALSWNVPAEGRVTLVRADPASSRGWWSPSYLRALPALSLAIEFAFQGDARIETHLHRA